MGDGKNAEDAESAEKQERGVRASFHCSAPIVLPKSLWQNDQGQNDEE